MLSLLSQEVPVSVHCSPWMVHYICCLYASDLYLQPLHQNAGGAPVVSLDSAACSPCRHLVKLQSRLKGLRVALFNDGKYSKRALGKLMHHFHLFSNNTEGENCLSKYTSFPSVAYLKRQKPLALPVFWNFCLFPTSLFIHRKDFCSFSFKDHASKHPHTPPLNININI